METMNYNENLEDSEHLRIDQASELQEYLRMIHGPSALNAQFGPDFSSVDAYTASTLDLKDLLSQSIGYPPPGLPPTNEPKFQLIAEDDSAVYYRTTIPVLQGLHVLGLYLVPKNHSLPAPLAIAQHGGNGSPEVATFHDGANYHDMVRGAVSRGYVVWAPQLMFLADGFPSDFRSRLDSRARSLGTTITAIEILKVRRGLDAVLARPEVNPDRVAMIGLSYGGFYTLYTTALDSRIGTAVSSCYFNDRDAVLGNAEPFGWNDWRFTNGSLLFKDPEIVAMICPRPLQIQVADKDELFPVEGARREAPSAARYYQELGCGANFEYVEFEGTHEFFGPAAWQFLDKFL